MVFSRFLMVCGIAVTAAVSGAAMARAADVDFSTFLDGIRRDAAAAGISQNMINRALPRTMKPVPRIIELDRRQPEGTKTIDEYLSGALSTKRIEQGRTRMLNNRTTLQKVSDAYGVEPEIIVALWGIETSYGQNTGGYGVVEALATLAHDGRRSSFFRSELMNALKILDEGHVAPENMKGSWAGAMGQCQFMPSSFLRFAVDFNNDGRRDIWGSLPDVFASTANYLAQSGWVKGQPWGYRVHLPSSFDRGLLGLDQVHSLYSLQSMGVRLSNGSSLPRDGHTRVSVIQPSGAGTAAFVVYDNFKTILKWNKSSYFAAAVGLLADAIRVP